MSTYTQAMKEAYASAPIEEVVQDTIEIRHPSFVDDLGVPFAVRITNGYEDIEARLEVDAPLNPGEYVTFLAGGFKLAQSGFEEGANPTLQLTVDNVSREITRYLEQAVTVGSPIQVTYRPYLLSDLEGPQMDPPPNMLLLEATANPFTVIGTATMDDVMNWRFPSRVYDVENFPGLFR